MQSYMGVKIIKAEPMERNGVPGYKVLYDNPGGTTYESWSPADVFEAAYLPLSDGRKITPDVVDSFTLPAEGSQLDEKTTIVKMDTVTGFVQYEVSSCVDPANYDHAIGVEIATKRIKDRIWPMLGFVLQWGLYGIKYRGAESTSA